VGVRDPGGHWVMCNLLDVVDHLRERGIDLVVLKQKVDTTTPAFGWRSTSWPRSTSSSVS